MRHPSTRILLACSPKHSTLGSVSVIAVPSATQLAAYTARVVANNGFATGPAAAMKHDDDGDDDNPVPDRLGERSRSIRHVVFINKENSTHDQMLGDITETRRGVPVEGEPSFSLGPDASPNHHELALSFALGDNFYLEPVVSSDGHRWPGPALIERSYADREAWRRYAG